MSIYGILNVTKSDKGAWDCNATICSAMNLMFSVDTDQLRNHEQYIGERRADCCPVLLCD